MFKILVPSDVQKKLEIIEKAYPIEVGSEVQHYIDILKRDGGIKKNNLYDTNTNEVSGSRCSIFFRTNYQKKEVLIVDVILRLLDIFKQNFKLEDDWNDNDVLSIIPQCDKPQKLINVLEFIYEGITDSAEIAYRLGNRAVKDKDNARHGQYAKQALEQLKLIRTERCGKKFLVELTDKGRLIAKANNLDLKSRLLIESMLNYPPIWKILNAVSLTEFKLNNGFVLSDQVIKEIVFDETIRDADTCNRRAQTLKSWIKWISKYSGIPICLNDDCIQLTIPMLYIDNHAMETE